MGTNNTLSREALAKIMEGWSENRRAVFQAIVDLCEAKQLASRRAISEATGRPMQIVDDHCRNLKEDGFIRAIQPGVFAPESIEPDRPVSGTVTVTGRYKLEVGDQILDLSLREARSIAQLTGGLLFQFSR
jgi:hypothetical protein